MQRLTILMTEGSSTSAREALYALGPHHVIDVLDPSPLCQCRFSRFVRRWYRCSPFGRDPCGYLTRLGQLLRAREYDVLFPPHDEVYLLSRVREALAERIAVAIPAFDSVERLHSKTMFLALLEELQLPHPETAVVTQRCEIDRWTSFPRYVKLETGTAGQGVRLVRDRRELLNALRQFEEQRVWRDGEPLLFQQLAEGRQCVVRVVFRRGELISIHMNALLLRGVGGAASSREACAHPVVVEHMQRLGQHLNWHGALFAEYFYNEQSQSPSYIEADPRIGDTANATLSGIDVCRSWIDVALNRSTKTTMGPTAPAAANEAAHAAGVRSHGGYLILISKALERASRRELLAEVWRQCGRTQMYEHSEEELTRFGDDWLSALPYAWIAGQLLVRPAAANRIVRRTVERYGLSRDGAENIRGMPLEKLVACLKG